MADVIPRLIPAPCAVRRGVLLGVAPVLGSARNGGLFHLARRDSVARRADSCLLAAIDRFVYPVCPACSHSHQHDHCATRLHGFATPLLAAAALHSALDGWSAAASQNAGFSMALIGASRCTRFPKGWPWELSRGRRLAHGLSALAWCALAQMATIAGAGFESVLAPHMSSQGLHALLALAGGSFLYLGGHAVHGELRRSGNLTLVPALTGVAGSSVLRLFVR